MSDPVFLVWRLDFDSLENREPVHRRIIGYATTPEAAGAAAKAEFDLAEKYEGYDRGWGGAKTTYPKFEAEMVQPIGAPTPEQREAPAPGLEMQRAYQDARERYLTHKGKCSRPFCGVNAHGNGCKDERRLYDACRDALRERNAAATQPTATKPQTATATLSIPEPGMSGGAPGYSPRIVAPPPGGKR